VSVTQVGEGAHGLLPAGPGLEQGQLRRTQDLGPVDKPYLVNRTENVHDAGILFHQTLVTVTSSNQIGGLGDVGDAFQETQSDPVQKAVSVIQSIASLGILDMMDMARLQCG